MSRIRASPQQERNKELSAWRARQSSTLLCPDLRKECVVRPRVREREERRCESPSLELRVRSDVRRPTIPGEL